MRSSCFLNLVSSRLPGRRRPAERLAVRHYYVFPAPETGAPEERDVRVASRDGYRIALWEEPGVGHALVADLPTAEILALARYCMRQMLAEAAAGRSLVHG